MRRIGFRRVIVVLVVLVCAALVWFNFFRAKMIGEFFATMKMPAVAISATTRRADHLETRDPRDRHARGGAGRRTSPRSWPAW